MTTLTSHTPPLSLAEVIDTEFLEVHFQPIVSPRAGRVIAYEALARGPAGTPYVQPLTMFDEARASGRLASLEQACRRKAITGWAAQGLEDRLFLNVSPEVLLDPAHRSGMTRELLERSGLAPHRLVIELTEQSPGIDHELMAEAVCHYQSMGFAIALDDLGDGYASLRLWSHLSPEFVKLDRHFVQGIDNDRTKRRFVRSFIEISHGLGSQIIAEGVERVEELDVLLELGVDFCQGWLFGHPTPRPGQERAVLNDRLVELQRRNRRQLVDSALHKLVQPQPALAPDTTVAEAAERFGELPQVNALAVVDDECRVIGTLSRRQLMGLVGKRYGFDLHGKQPVSRVMNPAALTVEVSEPLEQVSRKVTAREHEVSDEDFSITKNGLYQGMGQVLRLLQLITERQVQLARQANPLTQLPGNLPIRAALERNCQMSLPFVACMFDLDNFKPFNDRFGYALGDSLLLTLAETLQADCEEGDFIGHLGGDDFVLLLARVTDVQRRLARLQARFVEACRGKLPRQAIEAGGFHAMDRFGTRRFFPLTRASVVALTVTEPLPIETISDIWGQWKSVAKRSANGRAVLVGRRTQ
jgi:EAL domain-containing protein (putative c-di-GMP-specific phosphodiesterase class I)/GGDEF domain-containing protein/CBS domain-containing protein